jgi:glycine/D-amino acid oxidase-like deaminating enzyme
VNPEILIVGQGLAGTTLALQLYRSGIPFLVVDNPSISRSSRVAAGLFNPVVFKRMNLGWRTHDCLKEAISFYRFVEQLTESSFCHANGMHRIHGSADERKLWDERLLELGWEHHIEDTLPAENHPWLNQPFDGARVKSAGYINTLEYLHSVGNWLKNQHLLIEATFQYEALRTSEPMLQWQDHQFNKVVFCEGFKLAENPWFPESYLNPAKGEVLIIEAPDLPQEVINGKVYCVPLGNSRFKVGSTYAWNQSNPLPTEEKKQELIQTLQKMLCVPFEVIDHDAGIRPTVIDRRPIFGASTLHSNIFAFNGLGTKGVVLAPLLTKEIAQFFLDGTPIPEDYSIERFQWKQSN